MPAATDDILAAALPNGLRVIVREGHSVNLAAVDIWIRAGSANETPETNGVSHFVEHMIFKATAKYGPGEIDRTVEGVGAELNGGTSKDWQHFYTTVASEYLPVVLDALADAITNARFEPAEVEKERGIILDEIAHAESDPAQRAMRLFHETAYTAHPYRLPATGTRESIGKLARRDLVDYYAARYTPENLCVVIVGDVVKSDALALVERKFGRFQGKSSESTVAGEPRQTAPRTRHVRLDSQQSYVVVGYHGPSVSDFKESCALDVGLAALGDTYRGRLSTALAGREIGFTKIAVDFITQRDPSIFSVLVATDPANAGKAAQVVLEEMHRLGSESLTAAELAQAKRLIEGSDMFEQETFSGQARALGLYEAIASYDLALSYAETVRSKTQADVLNAAKKYLSGEGYTLVTLGPTGVEP